MTEGRRYSPLGAEQSPDALEAEMLQLWAAEGLFRRTLAARADGPPFVFLEGPPTANGRPGIHHVFARTVKDLFCRHRAMKGFHVDRKAGWDTHGLPVEIEVEKQLGINGKQQIEELGVERFNALCRESVWTYRGDWQKLSERIGFWLDYDDPYVTYSPEYVESVWWALATLYRKGLLTRGHKILPYCPRCGTTLSSHEVAQGYETVEDPSLYIALDLEPVRDGERRRRILVWTTTPWTLVSNAALAVHPELTYVELRRLNRADEGTVILVEERVGAVLGEDHADRWERVRSFPGSELAGLRYRRPLDWVPYGDGEHEIIVAEPFVSAEDGTGVVHMSPAFGADDYASGKRHGLAFLQPVNSRGEFPEEVPLVGGKFVKDADPLIVEELRRTGVLWRVGKLEHSYPHCWRCRTPLLYYARNSWFVRTTEYRDRMLARNSRVDWHPPEMGSGRFGEWLTNNIDWAVSRDRYWGTPIPLWVCDADESHIDAVGSYAELAERAAAPLPDDFDPHKPHVDRYEWPCTQCADAGAAGTMRRIPEVVDAWFDSGSMPFAQWHFPFEGKEEFERHYPADFIAEGVDQTRGWFYSMLAIATGLGDSLPRNAEPSAGQGVAPYRSVVVNDLVLDARGQKMSKSRGNAVDPWAVIPNHGADAVRLFLVASSQIWVPRRFDEATIRETAGRFLLTVRNIYSGIFAEYANFGWAPSDADPPPAERPELDRWILSRLATVEQGMDRLLDAFDATSAARLVMEFIDDDVSKWYVRSSRARFYDVDTDDNRAAFATLHEVLTVSCRLLAPFAPFISDWMHRELTGTSVHLASFVRENPPLPDPVLERAMGHIRVLSRLGRAAREEAGVKVRQPLEKVVVVVPGAEEAAITPLLHLLEAELNVHSVELASSADGFVRLAAKANFRVLGRRFGKQTPLAAEAIAALDSQALRAFERGEPLAISVEGSTHLLAAEDLEVHRHAAGDLVMSSDSGYFAGIDPTVSPALRREGLARELISRVQRMRKDAGLEVSDRIRLAVAGDAELDESVTEYRSRIAAEVLAVDVSLGERAFERHNAVQAVDLDGVAARIALTKENDR